MVDTNSIARSRAIQRRTDSTFHLATRLFPRRTRGATYVLYAFFRVADEVVDDAGDASLPEQRATLERFRDAALGEPLADDAYSPTTVSVLRAFAAVRERYGLDPADVDAFVDAMVSDTYVSRYETYADLETYMDGSAAAVGRMMTAIMCPNDAARERALPHATALGEAFQLTNFLRDVREDVLERDRVYLPEETLAAYDVDPDEIRALTFSDGVVGAVRAELARAERLYGEGVAGIEHLPADCQFPVLLAATLYAEHHRLIRDLDYDVLAVTPSLGVRRSASVLARTAVNWFRTHDPLATFEAVTDLRPEADRERQPLGTGEPSA